MNQNTIFEDDLDIYFNEEELNKFPSEYPPLNSEPFANHDSGDSVSLSGTGNSEPFAAVWRNGQQAWAGFYIDPQQFVSNQFYTFNKSSHDLMINCILAGRKATQEEIRNVSPEHVLDTWRNAWKDRNEDTAFVTAWKRIQEKMDVHVDSESGNKFLFFKTNSGRFVPFIEQWFDIVMQFHCEGDSRHLGFKDTVEGVRTMWTVNAKYYGIPESFIRVCVNKCPICCDPSSGLAPVIKRRKFEFTETIHVPVKEVETRLQELAEKYKVVLCVKQKYVRHSPYVAEVKDYACDRAGERTTKNVKDSTKSKRCGCNFRIKVIVPVVERIEEGKPKAFVFKDEGFAEFKLYAVHSGHETGELDGNARIMHSVSGNEDGVLMDQNVGNGTREEEKESLQHSLSGYLKELKSDAEWIEAKFGNIPLELLGSATQAAFEALYTLRSWKEHVSKQHFDDVLVGGTDSVNWVHDQTISGDLKPAELIKDNGNSFGGTLGNSASRGQVRTDCRDMRD